MNNVSVIIESQLGGNMKTNHTFTMIAYVWTLVLLGLSSATLLAQESTPEQNSTPFTKPLANEIKQIANIFMLDHFGLGWRCEELGDLNHDGYDDYAVSSYCDTTWVFFGGDPIPTEPVCFVLGGGCAIEAADVNRDGHTDLITASNWMAQEYTYGDPDWWGRVEIFLNTGDSIPFRPIPDQTLGGDSTLELSHLGAMNSQGRHEGMKALDINGDGNIDLLCTCYNLATRSYAYVLYMNGYPYSSAPDKFLGIPVRDCYGRVLDFWDFMTGDINGDSMSDILVFNAWKPDSASYVLGCEVFLGSRDADVSASNTILGYDGKWQISDVACGIADINADGYDDIFNGTPDVIHDLVDVWYGRPEIRTIDAPDDSLEMPDPMVFKNAQCVCPVGDMNGDGTRDVLVGWAFWSDLFSRSFYFHGSRPDALHKEPFGSVGLDSRLEFIRIDFTYPAGDVNGDGYDDILFLGGTTKITEWTNRNRFKIFGGSRKLVGVLTQQKQPERWQLQVYPNPVTDGSTVRMEIRAREHAQAQVRVIDLFGRLLYTDTVAVAPGTQTVTLPLHNFASGYYRIELTGGAIRLSTSIIRY